MLAFVSRLGSHLRAFNVSDTYIARRFLPETKTAGRVYGARRDYKIFLSARFRAAENWISWYPRASKWSAEWTMKAPATTSRRGFDDVALMEKP